MGFLKDYLFRFKGAILTGQGFKLLEAVLELYMPLVMASLIDDGISSGNVNLITTRGFTMLILALAGISAALICQIIATKASVRFGTELREDAFQHFSSLSKREREEIGSDSALVRISYDVNTLQDALAMLIRLVVRAPFLAIGSIVMAIKLDIQLSIVFLVTTPLIVLVMAALLYLSAKRYQNLQKMMDHLSLMARETLLGTRVIRAFSRENENFKKAKIQTHQYADEAMALGRFSALLSPATGLLMNFGIVAVLYFGSFRVQSASVSLGVLIAFINYMIQILLQTAVIANLMGLYTRAFSAHKRLHQLFTMRSSVSDRRWREKETQASQHEVLSFHQVSFAYEDNRDMTLENLSFSLKNGQSLGIIGGTGSGKSTVAALCLRLYDPSEGEIRFMGEELRDIPLKELHSLVSCVPQEARLFKGTLRFNLCLGKNGISDKTLWEALEVAQAADFVRAYPEGLDHLIEENARNLSGGQKQRLTIARALIGDAKLLILDDVSSALDFKTDKALRLALKSSRPQISAIIISQRASVLKSLTQILVLEDGKVQGLGKHEELLNSCKAYQEILQSQQEGGVSLNA